jgi:hypothetical protein
MKKYLVITALLMLVSCSPELTRDITELEYPEELNMVKRADWGWVPIDTTFKVHEIEKITIHHGGVEFKRGTDPEEHLRNLQAWSRSEKHWIDIPYHYMIDLDGNIYECRPINIPGDTNTEYDPESHALICVMGNYEIQELSEEQLDALIKMCVYLVQKFDVPVSEIKGHKDYSGMTVCPGKNLYRYLADGTIVRRVKKMIEEGSED